MLTQNYHPKNCKIRGAMGSKVELLRKQIQAFMMLLILPLLRTSNWLASPHVEVSFGTTAEKG